MLETIILGIWLVGMYCVCTSYGEPEYELSEYGKYWERIM